MLVLGGVGEDMLWWGFLHRILTLDCLEDLLHLREWLFLTKSRNARQRLGGSHFGGQDWRLSDRIKDS